MGGGHQVSQQTPAGKDQIELMTSEADSSTGLQDPGADFGGMDDSGCNGGCF